MYFTLMFFFLVQRVADLFDNSVVFLFSTIPGFSISWQGSASHTSDLYGHYPSYRLFVRDPYGVEG